jgi:hypothetical protein
MGMEHLEGKRTGRPRGSKSRPAWVRDVRWAHKHLGQSGATPPTPLAGLLLNLGCEHPDRLVACLALADPLLPQAAQPERHADDTQLRCGAGTNGRAPD